MSCCFPRPALMHKVKAYDKVKHCWTIKNNITFLSNEDKSKYIGSPDYIEIPCGRCFECRLAYSREWASRCVLEAQQYKFNYFVTLTYDDNNVPILDTVDKTSGEILNYQSLVKKDLQKFLKDLRAYYDYHYKHTGIRFFACGEYGSTTFRPHYHLILFNLPIYDLKLYKAGHFPLYNSKTLEKIWEKGFVVIGECNFLTCAYTARYVMKKAGTDGQIFDDFVDFNKEFLVMSRRPGIGRLYFENNMSHIYDFDSLLIAKGDETITVKPPKYFDRLYNNVDPDHLDKLKKDRRDFAKKSKELKKTLTSLPLEQFEDISHLVHKSKLKALTREI